MKRKNIIWVLTDQLRADALGINGDPNAKTPNIDNLALTGINFNKAVSGAPLCCPYRGSIITGRYPHNSSVAKHEDQLAPSMRTVADYFNEVNYDTIYYGKWHLEGFKEQEGEKWQRVGKMNIPRERRGRFKTWVGYENNNDPFSCWLHGHEEEKEVPLYRVADYETDAIVNMGIRQVEKYGEKKREGKEENFFMVLSVQPPHDPYVGPAKNMSHFNAKDLKLKENVPSYESVQNWARQDLRGMYAMLENIDENMGRLVQSLREQNLDEDTYIIFFSDHGDAHGSHGYERKMSPYEESIRIPFIISQGINNSYVNGWMPHDTDSLVNHVDLIPTSLGLAGIDVPEQLIGHDYSEHFDRYKVINNKIEEPDSAFLQIIDPPAHGACVNKSWRAVVTKDGWKYATFENGHEWCLYNLNEDPQELINHVHLGNYEEVRLKLRNKLEEWIIQTEDSFKI